MAVCIAAAGVLLVGETLLALQADDFRRRASWQAPPAAQVRADLESWLEQQTLDPARQQQINSLWEPADSSPETPRLLAQFVATVALVDPEAKRLAVDCSALAAPLSVGNHDWLDSGRLPEFVRHNLKLYYGRWLAQHAYYDEALRQLGALQPDQVVDPATLLFYQSVVHHRLLHRQECLDGIARLLENEESLPRRYVTVARLMAADIRPLKQDSLDEIARMMQNVQRRLRLGRAGLRVRNEEDEVIAKLDKMIEEKEQQQQQQKQQQSSSGGQGSNRSSNPAQDSAPLGGSGPGDVDQKPIGSKSGWGNLPPKKRQEALQQISKDLPSHYREVIEEYFRRLAQDRER